jgi:uncharacterized membrane protein
MEIRSRDLSLIVIFASLYAVLVWAFAPISFYALQFRVAGVLRPGIAKKWVLAIGYTIGVVVGNLLSPFTGLYELLFMPFMSLVAGLLGYAAARIFNRSYFVAGLVIATVIPLSVSWMLLQLFNLPVIATLPSIFVSEQAICLIGVALFRAMEARYKWWEP